MKNKILPIVLVVTLTSACAINKPDDQSTNPSEAVSGSVDSTSADTGEFSNADSTGADAADSGNADSTDSSDIAATTDSNVESGEKYEFNPHVFSQREADYRGEEIRDAFFNFVDALRIGEDTFECASEDAYRWATGGRLANYYFPIASNYITDGDYSDGVGQITYLIPKEEFLEKEKEFESAIESVLDEYVDSSYSDFEKVLSLYIYMTQNYEYDYDKSYRLHEPETQDVLTINAFESKTGICQELSGVYAYLLLQCGVETEVITGDPGEYGTEGHQWNLVDLGGTLYHVDPTYGLHTSYNYDDHSPLAYFLMTDEERANDGEYDNSSFGIFGIGNEARELIDYSVTDDKYHELHNGYFIGLDTDNNVLTYCDCDTDETKEYHYE